MSVGDHQIRAASLEDLEAAGSLVASLDGHAVVLFKSGESVFAMDNRCPHMGFPLHRGSVSGCILTCHWHHARFDMATGGTFDPWADDVRSYPVDVRDGEIWVDLRPRVDPRQHQRQRLREGLEHNLPLVIAKNVIALVSGVDAAPEALQVGLLFGSRCRWQGWGQGLTMLTCFANLVPGLEPDDRLRAMYQGLSAVAKDCDSQNQRYPLQPLPGTTAEVSTYKEWFRQFVEVRDADGAERCIASIVAAGIPKAEVADILFAAATDRRYIQIGHVMDFTNKALEALDLAGWENAAEVLPSLAVGYAKADRMEESNAWRHPVDLISLLEVAFEGLAEAMERGRSVTGRWEEPDGLVGTLVGDDPSASVEALLEALRRGATAAVLAGVVTHAAALRIAQFALSNEFADWDTALHTFTFANAVHHATFRSPSTELVRGVFDAAMSVYLDRFLNVPPVPVPRFEAVTDEPALILAELPALLDRQQQVNQAGEMVARYLDGGGSVEPLVTVLGKVLVREDRDFHSIQTMEAAVSQLAVDSRPERIKTLLVAAARYLSAHAPTVRAQDQTFQIAHRLAQGDRLHEDVESMVTTVLITDIVESTERAAKLGDSRWRDLLELHNEAVREELRRFGGREVGTTGDGFVAIFERPTRAIKCATAIVESVARLGVDVRAGLHTGECEVRDGEAAGLAFHVCARVAAEASPREVLMTSTVRDLVAGSGVAVVDRGRQVLKGVAAPVDIYAVKV